MVRVRKSWCTRLNIWNLFKGADICNNTWNLGWEEVESFDQIKRAYFIHEGCPVAKERMAWDTWLDKEAVVHVYKGILLGRKKRWNTAIWKNNVKGLGKGSPELFSPLYTHNRDSKDTKRQYLGRKCPLKSKAVYCYYFYQRVGKRIDAKCSNASPSKVSTFFSEGQTCHMGFSLHSSSNDRQLGRGQPGLLCLSSAPPKDRNHVLWKQLAMSHWLSPRQRTTKRATGIVSATPMQLNHIFIEHKTEHSPEINENKKGRKIF